MEELEEAPVKLIPYPQEVEWDMGTAEFQNLRLVIGPEVEADIQKDPFWVGFEDSFLYQWLEYPGSGNPLEKRRALLDAGCGEGIFKKGLE